MEAVNTTDHQACDCSDSWDRFNKTYCECDANSERYCQLVLRSEWNGRCLESRFPRSQGEVDMDHVQCDGGVDVLHHELRRM